ncbi:YolD-like family protein [Ammoniphilus sp. YIM 78166]|uniref:YolD-like family protein n=1 Tax=Ammoniphilus sp. YIM 78166 TaxID=1644106 RepID=UPI00142FD6DA|nr:YolD-like family protein [Ammoniphilus sp. YIM 78166]
MIRDRGNIKWSTMMLPEHRQLLQELEHSQDEQECPEPSEDKWEELQLVIGEAIETRKEVTLKYFANKRFHRLTGQIQKYDPIGRLFSIVSREGTIERVSFAAIIDAAME